MKTFLTLLASSCVAASLAAADATEEVKAAAKKLADKPNYSWTSTTKSEGNTGGRNFRFGPTEGKAEKGGWVRTVSSFGDTKTETFLKGEKFATRRDDEWKTAEDLEGDDRGAFTIRRMKAFKTPAAEAEDLAGKSNELKKSDDGVYSGGLTEEGLKAKFFGGFGRPDSKLPPDAKGSVRFWIKEGVLTKFEYNVQGTRKRFNSDEEYKSDSTTSVEIKEVGTTKVDVPAEVKKKLS